MSRKSNINLENVRIGNSIRRIRIKNQLSQEWVAETVLECNAGTYNGYENGVHEMGILRIMKLAKFYNISIDELIDHHVAVAQEPVMPYANGNGKSMQINLTISGDSPQMQKFIDEIGNIFKSGRVDMNPDETE